MTLHVVGDDRHVESLFQARAVGFRYGEGIRFKGNILSPGAYNNNRVLPSHPEHWDIILDGMIGRAEELRQDWDVIASVATGGIVHGAAIARALKVSHFIIKKAEKENHGLKGLIDGDVGLLPRARVLMVEDMSSTFKSAPVAMRPLVAEHARVTHTLAISTWGFPIFYQNSADHDVSVLCTGDTLISEAPKYGKYTPGYLRVLTGWQKNPDDETWVTDEWHIPPPIAT